jgi:hypothetical protein
MSRIQRHEEIAIFKSGKEDFEQNLEEVKRVPTYS